MKNETCLFALICAISLIGGFATSLKLLDGVIPTNASQPPADVATKSGASDADLGVEHYYHFKH
jgi:hypothetical protein